MSDLVVKAENLWFSYDDGNNYSLKGFSLNLERGKKVAIMGSNGAGKSTFFLCLNGIHQISKGALEVDGQPVDYSRKGLLQLRQKVGIVFQDPDNQLFSASVREEISFGALNIGMSQEETAAAVDRVMETLEISQFQHRPVHALSGGQKKQVTIADVVVMNPKIIILDEPCSSLDPKHTEIVNSIVNYLSDQGITVLMSTHNVDYAHQWADEVVVIHDGKVVCHDVPEKVFAETDILAMTNLKKPAAMELFEALVAKGVLDGNLPVPRSLEQLEDYITTG